MHGLYVVKMKKTADYLRRKKVNGQPITMLTCYDFPTAQWEDEANVDIIFVGDSVGTNVLGYESERDVTLDDIRHHLRAVRRGTKTSYLLADLPYRTYETKEAALRNAQHLCNDGADGVKLEGYNPGIVAHLVSNGIEVCAHLGLTPQWHEKKRLQANTAESAIQLLRESILLQKAGAFMIVYELIPEEVAKEATMSLNIPSIGIGAGRFTDGQVQVISDVVGMNVCAFRHSSKQEEFRNRGIAAIVRYVNEVASGKFPALQNVRHLPSEESVQFSGTTKDRTNRCTQ